MKRNAVWPAQTAAAAGWPPTELQVDGVTGAAAGPDPVTEGIDRDGFDEDGDEL